MERKLIMYFMARIKVATDDFKNNIDSYLREYLKPQQIGIIKKDIQKVIDDYILNIHYNRNKQLCGLLLNKYKYRLHGFISISKLSTIGTKEIAVLKYIKSYGDQIQDLIDLLNEAGTLYKKAFTLETISDKAKDLLNEFDW